MTQGGLRTLLLLCGAVYLMATLPGILHYPAVWVDEGWIAEPGWSLARGGVLGSPSHGAWSRFDDRLYWMPPLEFLGLWGVFATGLPPLLGGRLLSVLAGLGTLLILVGWGAEVLRDPGGRPSQAGVGAGPTSSPLWPWLLGAALLFTLDPTLWKVHRTIRFEALLGFWTLAAAALAWNPGRRRRGLLAGAAAGLAMGTHPNGIFALAGAAGLLVLRRRGGLRAAAGEAAAAAVAAAAVCLPVALYLWGDRSFDFANILGQNAPHLSGRSHPLAEQWLLETRRYASYFAWPYLALPLVLWAAVLGAVIRLRAPAGLVWLLAVFAGGLASLPNKSELYLTLLAPFLYLGAAWVGQRTKPRALAAGLGVLWVLNLAAADGALLWRHRRQDYGAWASVLTAPVPAGASVAGTFLTWFPLRNHPYLEVHRQRAGDLFDARPAFVIWGDAHMQDPLFERLREELGPFLRESADTLAASASEEYGTAVLLRPRWEEASPAAAAGWERYRESGGGSP